MGRLENKVAIVTGGGRGLGKAFSLAMAKEGAKVVVVDILEKEGPQTAEEIRNGGARGCHFLVSVIVPRRPRYLTWVHRFSVP